MMQQRSSNVDNLLTKVDKDSISSVIELGYPEWEIYPSNLSSKEDEKRTNIKQMTKLNQEEVYLHLYGERVWRTILRKPIFSTPEPSLNINLAVISRPVFCANDAFRPSEAVYLCLKVVCWGNKELLAKSPCSQLCLKVVCWGKKELLVKSPRSQLCLKVVCWGNKELLAKSPRSQLCVKVVFWGNKELLATSTSQRCKTCIGRSVHLSVRLSISQSFCPSLRRSVHLSVVLSISPSFCPSLRRSVHLSVVLSISPSFCPSLRRSVHLSVVLSISPSFCPSLRRSVHLSVVLSISPSFCPSLRRSVHLSVVLSISPSFCPSLRRSVHLSVVLSISPSFCPSLRRSVHLSVVLSISPSFCPSLRRSVHLSVVLSISPSFCPSLRRSVHLSVVLSISPSFCPSLRRSVHLSVVLSISPSFCPSLRRSVHLSVRLSISLTKAETILPFGLKHDWWKRNRYSSCQMLMGTFVWMMVEKEVGREREREYINSRGYLGPQLGTRERLGPQAGTRERLGPQAGTRERLGPQAVRDVKKEEVKSFGSSFSSATAHDVIWGRSAAISQAWCAGVMKELLAKSPHSQLCLKVVCWGKKELLAKSPISQLCVKVVCWGKEVLATSTNQRCETCLRESGKPTRKTTLDAPDQYSNLDPVLISLVYYEISALDHAANEIMSRMDGRKRNNGGYNDDDDDYDGRLVFIPRKKPTPMLLFFKRENLGNFIFRKLHESYIYDEIKV
uniref:Uncharacterized protein n=1 Tax=Timema monikensis TaxID=170555 RepID=A0A7R9E4C0_9NEOP|nr:unnamed protein product [Timema monikensis]